LSSASNSNLPEGYFRIGSAVCYGRTSRSVEVINGHDIPDLSGDIRFDGYTLQLPFDLAQVLENFQYERYPIVSGSSLGSLLSNKAAQRIYYLLRPWLHQPVRSRLQRFFFRDWAGMPFPQWPVDTSVEQLLERLLLLSMRCGNLDRLPFIWFWPGEFSAAAMMTHDVETAAGVRSVGALMDLDDEFGVKSSFQIVPEERYPVPDALLALIRGRQCEVNVHGLNHDGYLLRDWASFPKKAALINRYVQQYEAEGFRSPCMYRNLDYFQHLDISYDMSVPNVAHLEPQRGGCCTVFPYFAGNLLELPLTTIQDYSLFHILRDYSIELWKKQIDLIAGKHGLISFIVHPDYIAAEKPRAVYTNLLAYLSEQSRRRGFWLALPGEVNRWWRERSAMKLVAENGHWRIEGPGSERARIGFASLEGDRMVYRVGQSVEPCNGPKHAPNSGSFLRSEVAGFPSC
jgi:hypothetical protein